MLIMLFNITFIKRINIRFPLNSLNPKRVPIGMPIKAPISTAVPETVKDNDVIFQISSRKAFPTKGFHQLNLKRIPKINSAP
ncbi:MAG: hypothetical protein QXI39_04690 [Candidatus Bathyarchaeia archaeon]